MPAVDSDSGVPPTLKEKVRRLPDRPGVYLMKDRIGSIIYVGKAKALKKRVSSYFQPSRAFTLHPKIRALVEMIADFDAIEVKSEPEAILLEGKLIKQWKPRYNTDFTDDKRFLLVRVDPREELPRFRWCGSGRTTTPVFRAVRPQRPAAQGARPDAPAVRHPAQRRDAAPLPDGSWQLYDDVRAEIYGFPNSVTTEQYRERVDKAPAPSSRASPANGSCPSGPRWPPPPGAASSRRPPGCATSCSRSRRPSRGRGTSSARTRRR
jgi:excinuclease ABC subunit C